MNTQSNAMTESSSSRKNHAGSRSGSPSDVLVGSTRIVGEPFDLHRATGRGRCFSLRLRDQHAYSAAAHRAHRRSTRRNSTIYSPRDTNYRRH